MSKIAILPDDLINKIAAGEVVERPASVVKELCENALDAGAKVIRVSLAGGGLDRVCVSDDGCGMSREDAAASLLRHATSKLRDLEGLFAIETLGFRGEALPSIASVSRFSLQTCEREAASGTEVKKEGAGPIALHDAAPVPGTTVCVEDLFFNTPARRKFLRRQETELRHCSDAVLRLALAHPEVSFFVEHEGKSLLKAPACPEDPRERIAGAFGDGVYDALAAVDERRLGLSVKGHVAGPEISFPTARGLFLFVNRRYVRDRAVYSAVQRAFQEGLPPGRQPLAVLFIDVEPRAVDVNVHPQKLEVRFADGRGVTEAVHAGIARALQGRPQARAQQASPESPERYAFAVEQFLTRAQQAAWGRPLPAILEVREGDALLDGPRALEPGPPPGFFASLRWMGLLAQRFWVCEGRGGTLLVLDPHAAQERGALSRLSRAFERGELKGEAGLLSPKLVELLPQDADRLMDRMGGLAALGFEVEPFGGQALAVKAVPAALELADLPSVCSELAHVLPEGEAERTLELFAPSLQVLACHAARSFPREPSQAELAATFAELDAADFSLGCRHGRVVVTELPLLELERRAGGPER